MRKNILLFFILLIASAGAFSNNTFKGKGDSTLVLIPDDPIAAMLDSLMTMQYFEVNRFTTDTSMLNIHKYKADQIPNFDDFIYEIRLAKLNAKSPFDLVYNSAVKGYIDLYSVRKRETVSRMLGLAQIYFPMFEHKLDKYDLPLELKYLAIVESALNPNAVSKSGATGLWQFMYPTGKMYGLDVNSYIDERRDPLKATEAACKYFVDLYKMFNDWQMVLAAYNGGPGTLNKAIRRSGGKKTYWEVRSYLPLETQGYVPAFIAVNYIMNHTTEHNLYPVAPKSCYFLTDTVKIKQQVTFNQIATVLDLSVDDIEYLNPSYKKSIIPVFADRTFGLCLPVSKVGSFINNETIVYSYKSPEERMDSLLSAQLILMPEVRKIHKVRKGETMIAVSRKYGCSPDDIATWNHLKKNGALKPGQKITVYTKQQPSATMVAKAQKQESTVEVVKAETIVVNEAVEASQTSPQAVPVIQNKKANKPKVVYYTVQQGDTLWNIANRYAGVTVADLKKINGLKGKTLKPGMKLKVTVGS